MIASRRMIGGGVAVLLAILACWPAPAQLAATERVAFIGAKLRDEELVVCSAAVSAVHPAAVLLLDSQRMATANKAFLAAYEPTRVVPIGKFAKGTTALAKRLGQELEAPVRLERGVPVPLFADADRVVVCPADSRRLLLHSACLAGALKAPLVLLRASESADDLHGRIEQWKIRTVYAVGSAIETCRLLDGVEAVGLADEAAVAARYLKEIGKDGPVRTIVVANPGDVSRDLGRMSLCAPWIALQKKAALALTDDAGKNVDAVVAETLERSKLQPDNLILSASLQAIPTEHRPNPVKGKDAEIEMEPLTPTGTQTFTFATGRLFHADPGLVLLQLARGKLLEGPRRPRKALVVSNPGGGLPLLETFSRHTARELRNAGFETTAWFHDEVVKEAVRKALPKQDIFLWEGHYKTLTEEFGFLKWNEPLPPSLIFLQSCLALKEGEADPLFRRGAVAVVGSSTRTYSGTGGAFTLAFFNAMLYDGKSLGGALRQAKNFLLCYSLLKEKRLGEKAMLKGVNIRSSWAFTLWGDPTLKLPLPESPAERLDAVTHEESASRITVALPDTKYDRVKVSRYEAAMRPNARLAGLLRLGETEDERQLVPFVFAEVSFPKASRGQRPLLESKIPTRNWVFCWDAPRRTGYLLITPRSRDEDELRFRVEWSDKDE